MEIVNNNGRLLLDSKGIPYGEEIFLGVDVSSLPKDCTCIPVNPSLWKTKEEWEKDCEQKQRTPIDDMNDFMESVLEEVAERVSEQIDNYWRSMVVVFDKGVEDGQTLYLPLKEEWFRMIASGTKKEEYRHVNKYWSNRLVDHVLYNAPFKYVPMMFIKPFTRVEFSLGYPKSDDWSRRMLFEIKCISIGRGNTSWGAPADENVFKIELGERIK